MVACVYMCVYIYKYKTLQEWPTMGAQSQMKMNGKGSVCTVDTEEFSLGLL